MPPDQHVFLADLLISENAGGLKSLPEDNNFGRSLKVFNTSSPKMVLAQANPDRFAITTNSKFFPAWTGGRVAAFPAHPEVPDSTAGQSLRLAGREPADSAGTVGDLYPVVAAIQHRQFRTVVDDE